jgi:arylsulfatase A-like enzyme
MPDERPNVVFICTDQHRGDCIGADPDAPTDGAGRPLVHTPNLSNFVHSGALFSRAYSPAPTCVPARRCLWSGRVPANAKAATWRNEPWEFDDALPRLLRNQGYQTHLAGKTHSVPTRNHFGFEGMDLHSGLASAEAAGLDDYHAWLDDEYGGEAAEESHGLGRNGWDPRPWHLDEYAHPTHWTATRAEEFLERRDPTRPFFLTVSFVRPHQPFDPPRAHWDQYIDRDLPDPVVGDWVEGAHGDAVEAFPATNAWAADLDAETVHRARAGYYGSVTHIDQQVKRLQRSVGTASDRDTLYVMTADHGEMLGDHHLWRKAYAYEGSARVPLLLRFPDGWEQEPAGVIDRPVGLQDVAPTILDAAGIDAPDSMDGRSLLDLVDDPERDDWRSAYHGEHGPTYADENACQFLVDEETKYVWNPVTGDELLFDLDADPDEEHDRSGERPEELAAWRGRLADRLAGRPEGFVEDGDLRTVGPDAWLD